jgi:hypothetical protein
MGMAELLPYRFLTVALVGLAGCSSITGSDTRRVVGLINPGVTLPGTIVAPDTVQAGVSFRVTVYSFGSSSCVTPDGVDLTLKPTEARVTPFDRVPADPGTVCTADIAVHPHLVELRFTEPGLARIVAQGDVIEASSSRRVRGSVVKELQVVP